MRNLALLVEYDGTDFVGSQWQKNGRSVQAVLEQAWERVTQERRRVQLAGRTDAGVHAQGQVANIRTETGRDLPTLYRALNAVLPEDVAIHALAPVPLEFHARHSAIRREYRYLIDNAPVASAILRRYALHTAQQLDLTAMDAAARLLLGEHDFAAFAGGGPQEGGTVRRVLAATIHPVEVLGRALVAVDLAANAFLRHMVRNVVGTLVQVGTGALDLQRFSAILASRDRRQAGPTAGAHGLYLVSVGYPAGDTPAW